MFKRPGEQQPGDLAPAGDSVMEAVREPDDPDPLVDLLYAMLHEVIDPEVGVNIVDLGLVFEVTMVGRRADVRMTLTTPGCPLSGYMDDSIRYVLTQRPEIDDTHMDLVWDPAWGPHMMTDQAKRQLGWVQ
jgi:metal-sulfur cluster biosynthetic enzyme